MEQKSEYLRRPDAKGHMKVLELLRKWDPIGVICKDNQDEYASYAPRIIRLLDAGCTAKQLTQELYRIKTQHMGLKRSWFKTREKEISKELVTWWKEWKNSQTSCSPQRHR